MPRRNRRRSGAQHAHRSESRTVVYLRDRPCGKLAFPSYQAALDTAYRAQVLHQTDDDGHYIYWCHWSGSYHLSSRDQSEVDARRAYGLTHDDNEVSRP